MADKGLPKIKANVIHRPGAVRMDEFPLLAYGPLSGEPMVRVARTGKSVEEIIKFDDEHPDLPGAGIAGLFGLELDEWDEIVRWDELGEGAPGRMTPASSPDV